MIDHKKYHKDNIQS